MIVCVCRRVSDRAVDAAIAAGARDLEAIGRVTGAGTECGCCREELAVRATHRDAPCAPTPCPGCPRRAGPRSSSAPRSEAGEGERARDEAA
jgi:bacterioferritin-associated ferredoxin